MIQIIHGQNMDFDLKWNLAVLLHCILFKIVNKHQTHENI
jgi:hypothetical protein